MESIPVLEDQLPRLGVGAGGAWKYPGCEQSGFGVAQCFPVACTGSAQELQATNWEGAPGSELQLRAWGQSSSLGLQFQLETWG